VEKIIVGGIFLFCGVFLYLGIHITAAYHASKLSGWSTLTGRLGTALNVGWSFSNKNRRGI